MTSPNGIRTRDPREHQDAWRYGISSLDPPLRPIRSYPIEPDHPLVRQWHPLRDDIEAALNRSHVRWCALEVYHRRGTREPDNEQDDTTIVVTARGADERDWALLRRNILGLCAQHRQAQLQVELINGSVEYFRPDIHLAYNRISSMGSSLGLQGRNEESGTLGGYIRLQAHDKEPLYCALTCHHVVCPSERRKDDGDKEEKIYLPPGITTPDETFRVEQPSQKDHEAAQKALVDQISEFDDRITKYESDRMIGIWSETRQRGWESAREDRATHERLQSEATNFDRAFGHIWATSGYRVADRGCILDWGLVRVKEERRGWNKVSVIQSCHLQQIHRLT